MGTSMSDPAWPEVPYGAWADTCTTLHLWTQIVGKIRLAKSIWVNHSWHVTLYVTARGLTTSPIPDGERQIQIDFDFIDHRPASISRHTDKLRRAAQMGAAFRQPDHLRRKSASCTSPPCPQPV